MARARIPLGGHGEIGISKAPDSRGRFRAWVTVRELNGKTKLIQAFGPKNAAAITNVGRKLDEWKNGTPGLREDPSVEVLVLEWLRSRTITEDNSIGEISPQTYASYDYNIRTVITPLLGSVKARELRPSYAQNLLLSLIHENEGHSNARIAKTILKQAFDYAARNDLVRTNPIIAVKLPRKRSKGPRALGQEELLVLRKAVRDWRAGPGLSGPPKSEHLEDMFEVMLGTALRIGEVLALKWEDIDLNAKTATIHSTLVEKRPSRDKKTGNMGQGGFFYQDHRKGSGYEYIIELPDFVLEVLTRRYIENPSLNPINAVFVSRRGTWLRMSSMRRSFNAAKEAAGIKVTMDWSTPHSLRKTALTHITRTVSLKEASIQAGHADERVTKMHYAEPEVPVSTNGDVLDELRASSARTSNNQLLDRAEDEIHAPHLEEGTSRPGRTAGTGLESNPIELLRQLGSLHEAGIVSREEFDAKKAELLRRI